MRIIFLATLFNLGLSASIQAAIAQPAPPASTGQICFRTPAGKHHCHRHQAVRDNDQQFRRDAEDADAAYFGQKLETALACSADVGFAANSPKIGRLAVSFPDFGEYRPLPTIARTGIVPPGSGWDG